MRIVTFLISVLDRTPLALLPYDGGDKPPVAGNQSMKTNRLFYLCATLLLAACVRDGNVIRFDPSFFGGSAKGNTEASTDSSGRGSSAPQGGSSGSSSSASRPREKLPPGETWQGDDNYSHYKNKCVKGGNKECNEFADALNGKETFGISIEENGLERVRKEPPEIEDKIWAVSEPERCDTSLKESYCLPFSRFLDIFPGGGHHAKEAEKVAWKGTGKKECVAPKNSHDCDSLQYYLDNFPDGPHAAEAKRMIAQAKPKLEKLAAKEAIEEEAREARADARRKEKIEMYCPMKNGRRVGSGQYCIGLRGKSWHACVRNWNKCPING
jgi:hypothetical protein